VVAVAKVRVWLLCLAALALGGVAFYARTENHGCPFAVRDVHAAAQQEADALRTLRGNTQAPAGPVFSAPNLATFSKAMDTRMFGTCEQEGTALRCVAKDSTTHLRFAQDGSLLAWDTELRFAVDQASEAIAAYANDASALVRDFGEPHQHSGNTTAMTHPTRQVAARYRYEDRAIDLTLTHLGDGFVLHRQVRMLKGAR
jgi:hypothetical protein